VPSNKEILDAQKFNRRRLVTSFVSGAPGGRELEPGKPWRGVVGGLVLVALVLAGSYVSRWLSPGVPDGWDDGSLVVIEEDGSRYITSEGVMYPVLNTASARLLLGAGDMTVRTLSQSDVAGVDRGRTVGIPDAPDSLPDPDDLQNDAWLSCVAPSGATWTSIGGPAGESAEDQVSVVRVQDQVYVVAGTTSHEVASDQENAVLRALGLPSADVPVASADWIALFRPGDPIGPLATSGAGTELETPVDGHPEVGAGQAVVIESGAAAGDAYIVGTDGDLHPLSPVGLAMWELGDGAHLGEAVEVTAADLGQRDTGDAATPSTWPEEISGEITEVEGQHACALLSATSMSDRTGLAVSDDVPSVTSDTVAVSGGSGALVSGSGGGMLTADFFIDETGRAYPLLGERGTTLQMLGYTLEDRGLVPSAWLRLIPQGPPLQPLELPAPTSTEDGESPSDESPSVESESAAP
jgi:type VII secretion protein EccB